jgi:hypothetical protein
MHASSILAIIAAVSFASATPVEYGLQARGNTPSKPADIHCSGEIIGYRAVDKKVRYGSWFDRRFKVTSSHSEFSFYIKPVRDLNKT